MMYIIIPSLFILNRNMLYSQVQVHKYFALAFRLCILFWYFIRAYYFGILFDDRWVAGTPGARRLRCRPPAQQYSQHHWWRRRRPHKRRAATATCCRRRRSAPQSATQSATQSAVQSAVQSASYFAWRRAHRAPRAAPPPPRWAP